MYLELPQNGGIIFELQERKLKLRIHENLRGYKYISFVSNLIEKQRWAFGNQFNEWYSADSYLISVHLN